MPEQPPLEKPITRQMELFCQEYLVDLNAKRAAERAGYSAKSAHQLGHKLTKDPRVIARIEALMREREQQTRIKGFKVLEELAVVALSSHEHYLIDERGFVQVRADAPAGAMGAVSRIRRKARVLETIERGNGETHRTSQILEYETEIALYDKNPAIANAMKHLGLIKDVVEHRDLTLEDILRAAAGKPAGGESIDRIDPPDAGDRETK
jgi:phage terminase small subunit